MRSTLACAHADGAGAGRLTLYSIQAPARIARIRSLGAAEGLELNLHLARPVSTLDAHRLGKLAADRGQAEERMESLLHAYTEGLNVADPQVLQRLGDEAGLESDKLRAVLAGDDYPTSHHALASTGEHDPHGRGWTLHQLRHSALTHLAAAGRSAAELQAKNRHRHLAALGQYVRLGDDVAARITAENDPLARRRAR
ncbi:DsbA family protein [Nonomuraea sp. M3C6]|uniref:DsbA family protein n=1 Tax=Nonomuraea marmarensis TaxID=3351344 RepID=A0ABW7ASS4_9ACTN